MQAEVNSSPEETRGTGSKQDPMIIAAYWNDYLGCLQQRRLHELQGVYDRHVLFGHKRGKQRVENVNLARVNLLLTDLLFVSFFDKLAALTDNCISKSLISDEGCPVLDLEAVTGW